MSRCVLLGVQTACGLYPDKTGGERELKLPALFCATVFAKRDVCGRRCCFVELSRYPFMNRKSLYSVSSRMRPTQHARNLGTNDA